MSTIAENLARVEDAVAAACRKAGRARSQVRLMAVSKTHPVELLIEAAAAGHRLFGENRVQEFAAKSQALAAGSWQVQPSAAADALAVHLIGHLQSNKSASAAQVFSAVDTVDSLRLAERLYASAQQLGRRLPVLVEIKLSAEETKEGLAPDDPALDQLLERLPDLADHLPFTGLMTVAPIADDPAVARDCFRRLRELREALARKHARLNFSELSMGMSGDYEAAIAEGSTTIRIGTAIFGARPKPGNPIG
jgi:pyridoxal phosphate enzyme (YggS family)